jgi:hypothetical protein
MTSIASGYNRAVATGRMAETMLFALSDPRVSLILAAVAS